GAPSDRTLGQPTSLQLPKGFFPLAIKLSLDGRNLYLAADSAPGMGSSLFTYTVNHTTGALTLQDKVPATLATGGMAVSERFVCTAHAGASPYLPTSPYYSISCFARDPQNGTLRRVEEFALSTRPAEVEFGSPDVLYVTLYLRNAIGMLRL